MGDGLALLTELQLQNVSIEYVQLYRVADGGSIP